MNVISNKLLCIADQSNKGKRDGFQDRPVMPLGDDQYLTSSSLSFFPFSSRTVVLSFPSVLAMSCIRGVDGCVDISGDSSIFGISVTFVSVVSCKDIQIEF